MNNSRITPKERGLLKGAVRRVFSRSELRKQALAKCAVTAYTDQSRPRVKRWGICCSCKNIKPLYTFAVDHIDPVIPVSSSLEEMSWDEVVNRTWCEPINLQAICDSCHTEKTRVERKARTLNKRSKK